MTEQVEILRMSYGPYAVARRESGKIVFVRGGIPGEICEIEIFKETKKLDFARIVSRPVLAEKEPGASWADIDYLQQLECKRTNIVDAIVKNKCLSKDDAEEKTCSVLKSTEKFYRNKIELLWVQNKLGMMREETNEFCPIEHFDLAVENISCLPKKIAGALRFALHGEDCGLYRVGLRGSLRTGKIELALWTEPGWFPRQEVASILQSCAPFTSIVRIIANQNKMRRVKSVEVLAGRGYWHEKLGDLDYYVSAPSFFQVNSSQAEKLQEIVLDFLDDKKGSNESCKIVEVADLYCGCGTFTLPLARAGYEVVGVEVAGSSTRDLVRNLKRNNLKAKVICDDVERYLRKRPLVKACIVDPPASGLNKNACKYLLESNPSKIVYVSCDPTTLARDLKMFKDAGFEVNAIQPVDMFPQTYHVETVVLLERK